MEYDLTGKNKARALKALVNATRPLGMGMLQDRGRPMTEQDAEEVFGVTGDDKSRIFGDNQKPDRRMDVDYVWGRPIKINFNKSTIDLRLYDRDAGEGAGKRALDKEFADG